MHVAPSCSLCGNVRVNEGSLLGVGTKVIPNVDIGEWAVCGAGSIIIKPIAPNCVAYGVPATPQKYTASTAST